MEEMNELQQYIAEQKEAMEQFIVSNNMEAKKHKTCENGPLHKEMEYMDFIVNSAEKFVKDTNLNNIITR